MSKVNARIVHHRISTDNDFTPAPNSDFEEFNGWTALDLADGEIGVNLFREKIYANINGVVKQITTGEGTVTIDTTPITGGSTGYPLYHKSGNVVGEFTGAYFDTVNNRVGIGTTTPAGTLHVKGAGNLATDVVAQFNSENGTSGVFKVNGDGSFTIGSSGSNGINGYWGAGLYAVSIANLLFAVPDLNKVDVASGKRLEFNPGAYISTPGNGTIKISSVSGGALSNGMWLHPYSGSMSFGADHVQDGTHQATFYNGTAPSTAISTAFKMFSASGQPKFLLGNNDVIKLYKQPTPTTLSDVITLLTNLGLC